MSEPALVLLVSDNPGNVAMIRAALAAGEAQFSLQHVERARTAAARIAGGGVGLVLVDLSGVAAEGERSDAFQRLRTAAADVPVIVLCESEEEGSAIEMVKEGAARYVLRSDWTRALEACVRQAIAQQQSRSTGGARKGDKRGTLIAVLGAKGGVGATTVAVNVATALAATAEVILAELRPALGNLCQIFRPHRGTRTLQNLLPGEMEPQSIESCLWPNRAIPGLSVLFAPDKIWSKEEIGPERAREIVRRLSELSEVVVIDLPAAMSEANRAILAEADTLVLVVERDGLSVDAAKAKLGALEAENVVPQEAGSVIVNRAAFAAPLALSDIESQLGLPIFGVIPPAADLCAAAYRVHVPVVKLDADSTMATSLLNLAKRFFPAAVGSSVLRS